MRLSALLWPFPFGVRLGWATTAIANPDLSTAQGRVYFLRGNAIVFSGGFARMCGELRQAGLWAEDLRCVGDRWVRRHLRADHQAGRLRGPVVLVGHSCGGRYALHAARWLETWGVSIDLLICVDVAFPPPVPGNVRQAVNLYRTRWRIYPAGELRRAPGAGGVIDNVDLDAPTAPIAPAGLHHLNFTTAPAVQAWIVERIRTVVRGGSGNGPVAR